MLKVVVANRMELLAHALLAQLRVELLHRNPLVPMTIVVPSRGTGEWLKQQMATQFGIAANLDLVLPATFAWRVFRQFDATLPESSEYDLRNLRWRVLRLLETVDQRAFANLGDYLRSATPPRVSGDGELPGTDAQTASHGATATSAAELARAASSARKRYQLACRIADVFDQYLVYRRDWIERFEREPAQALAADSTLGQLPTLAERALFAREPWQAPLWRALVNDIGHDGHRGNVHARTLGLLVSERDVQRGALALGALASGVAVFGVAGMPPDFLDLLSALALHIDVRMFVPNPCREYWADVIAPREQSRVAVRDLLNAEAVAGKQANAGADTSSLASIASERYYESGNPLLASFGVMNRDFVDLVNERVDQLGAQAERHEFFAAPEGDGLLQRVQRDMLELRVAGRDAGRDAGRAGTEATSVAAADQSITLHSCHGALREVEVLHDQLLQRFEQDPTLRPRDVVVMIPQIAAYAPLIEAVFGGGGSGAARAQPFVPFVVADGGARDGATVVEGLFALFDLVGSRWAASDVLALLDIAAVQRRFSISTQSLGQIRHWLQSLGVRWGRDRAHWHAQGLPVDGEAGREPPGEQPNSWAFGIERLLLGYALPDGAAPVADVLPAPRIEGQVIGDLSAFLEVVAQLDHAMAALCIATTGGGWQTRIEEILNAFFKVEADDAVEARGLAAIRQAMAALHGETSGARLTAPLSLTIVREYLQERLLTVSELPGFLSGRVTFCTLVPMRAIPARVICLLGMNEVDFPRRRQPLGFDLMAHSAPRKGDRYRGAEDRQMFLDALLAARDALYISYVGQSDRADAPCTPSLLVSELNDYLDAHYGVAAEVTHATDTSTGAPTTAHTPLSVRLTTRHRLQPFSRRYFDGSPGLFSYDGRWLPPPVPAPFSAPLQGAMDEQTLAAAGQGPVAMSASIALLPADGIVTVEQMRAFIRRPSRWLLRERFGVRFPDEPRADADEEPFKVDALLQHQLKTAELRAESEARHTPQMAYAEFSGALPQGRLGSASVRTMSGEVRELKDRVAELACGEVATWPVRLPLRVPVGAASGGAATAGSTAAGHADIVIAGVVSNVMKTGWLGVRVGETKAPDIAELWLMHLLLTVAGREASASYLVDEKHHCSVTKVSVEAARAALMQLLAIMFTADAAVPPLLGVTAQQFVLNGLDDAMIAWRGKDQDDERGVPGERGDLDVRVLAGDGAEPRGEWQFVAEQVYGAMRGVYLPRKTNRGS